MGFTPNIFDEAMQLTGYRGDIREEKAEIIIPKEQVNSFTGASNDIGFAWIESEDKFEFICSEYDKKFKMDQRIIQAYVKVVLEESLAKNGFKITVNIDDDLLRQKQLNDLDIVARKII